MIPKFPSPVLVSLCFFAWGLDGLGFGVAAADDAAPLVKESAETSREPVEFGRRPVRINAHPDPNSEEAMVPEASVFSLAFSRDRKLLATGHSQGHVMVHRLGESVTEKVASQKLPQLGESVVRGLQFLDQGRRLAGVDIGGHATVLSASAGEWELEVEVPFPVNAIGVGKDDGRLWCLSADSALHVWEVPAGGQKPELTVQTKTDLDGEFQLMSVSAASDVIVLAGGNRCQVRRIQELSAKEVLSQRQVQGETSISAVRVSPDGTRFALGWSNGEISVHSVQDSMPQFRWKKHPNQVTCLAFSQTGKTLLSGCFKDRIRVWDLESGQHVNDRDVGLQLVAAMEVSADPTRVAVAGAGNEIALMDVQVPSAIFVPAIAKPKAWNNKAVHAVRFLPEQNEIAIVAKWGTMQRMNWEGESIEPGTEIDPKGESLKVARISPDGLMSAHGYQSGFVRVYKKGETNARWEFRGTPGLNDVAFSDDSKRLAIASGRDSSVAVVDLESGKPLMAKPAIGQDVRRVCFSSDGKSLFTVGHVSVAGGPYQRPTQEGILTRWKIDGGDSMNTTQSVDIFAGVEVSPKGTRILTGGMPGMIRVHDENLLFERLIEVGGRGGIHVMRMIDEDRVLVGTYKGTVLLIDVNAGVELARLEPLPEHRLMPVRDIDYAPASRRVIVGGGYDGAEVMRIYELPE